MSPSGPRAHDRSEREVGVVLSGGVDTPSEGGPDVVELGVDAPRPGALVGAEQLGARPLAEFGVVAGVAAAPPLGLTRGVEPLAANARSVSSSE